MLSKGIIDSSKTIVVGLLYRLYTQVNSLSNIIGIDLGGTNSVLSMMEGNSVRIIENAEGARYTPSYITYNKSTNNSLNQSVVQKLFGINSKQLSIREQLNTFYGLKYFYGRQYDDDFIKKIKPKLYYSIAKEEKDNSIVFKDQANTKHSLQSISSDYLSYLKMQAEGVVGKPIYKAIMSLPRFINQKGKDELRVIMKKSGIKVIRFIDEPIAALFGYKAHLNPKSNGVLVISIGGLDSSYSFVTKHNQSKSNDIVDSYLIRNELFDYSIGGNYFNQVLLNYFTQKYQKENKIDLTNDVNVIERLSSSIENAKIELSQSGQSHINIPFLAIDKHNIPKHFNCNLTRSTFDTLTDSLTAKIKANCIKIKNEINTKQTNNSTTTIDDIILVGGTTRIPKIQSIIREVFDNRPINRLINPEEAPSQGCAVISGLIKDSIANKTVIDYIKRMPTSLGIETLGGKFTKLITRTDILPSEVSKTLTTVIDHQPKIDIKFYLGERPIAKDNMLIGTISLNIPLALRNSIKIQLIVSMHNNGDVTVGAIETLSKKSATLNTNIMHLLDIENFNDNNESKETKSENEEEASKLALANLKVKVDLFIHKCNIELAQMKTESIPPNHNNELNQIKESINNITQIICNDNYNEIHSAYTQLKGMIAKNELLKLKLSLTKVQRK